MVDGTGDDGWNETDGWTELINMTRGCREESFFLSYFLSFFLSFVDS